MFEAGDQDAFSGELQQQLEQFQFKTYCPAQFQRLR